ncbi:branched-chain amino acid transport system permease protein [Spirochaetota bacterium]|nr:branched-chain amino acid transport system permease protein [Spirochaetota bacterium]
MYYVLSLLTQIGIYAVIALSFNLALGFTGIINLSHISFLALGAYTTAILYTQFGMSFGVVMVLSGLLSGCVALFLIYACRKLRGDYLALGTLSFHFVIYSFIRNLETITGGTRGLIVDRPAFINDGINFFIMVVGLAVVFTFILARIVRSPFGTLLGAVRDDEKLARALGKDSQLLKVKAIVISAFITGVMGGVLAFFLRYVHPDFFFLYELVTILTIVIIGGLASLRGTLIATFIVLLIPEILRFVALPSSIIGPSRQILYSIILLLILLIHSRGILGKVDLH